MPKLEMKAINDRIVAAQTDVFLAGDMLARGDALNCDSFLQMAIRKLLEVRLAVIVAYPRDAGRKPAAE